MKLNERAMGIIDSIGGMFAVLCLAEIYPHMHHSALKVIVWLLLAFTSLATVHLIFRAARRETLRRIAKLEQAKK